MMPDAQTPPPIDVDIVSEMQAICDQWNASDDGDDTILVYGDKLAALLAEISALRDDSPGTPRGIVKDLFAAAERHGMLPVSSEPPLWYILRKLTSAETRLAEAAERERGLRAAIKEALQETQISPFCYSDAKAMTRVVVYVKEILTAALASQPIRPGTDSGARVGEGGGG